MSKNSSGKEKHRVKKNLHGVKITDFKKMSLLNYIYYNELYLGIENNFTVIIFWQWKNFTVNITENNAVYHKKVIAWEEYLLPTCRIKPNKEDDIKNWMTMIK